MQDWAREQGIQRIELTVMAHNDAAIALYERNGFTIEGIKKGAIVVDGNLVDEIMMGMRL
jgi:RimJ/RimL family protein N-acetyltransferase